MASRNTPPPGDVYLDHTAHFVADQDSAAAALGALGFTVTPYSVQTVPDPATGAPTPTGTANICVMLPEGYLEFLVHTADTPIGLEFRAALERRAGLHLAAFGVADAAERHAALASGGHAMRPLVHMTRDVETPAGPVPAQFTVARLVAGTMPEGRVQLVTHGTEAAMWQPRWTAHDNGARRLAALVISAPDPEEAAGRFARFLGLSASPWRDGYRLQLARGAVEFLPEAAAEALVGEPVETGRPAMAAVRIAVDDLDAIRRRAEEADMPPRASGDGLALPFGAALGRGSWLFEAA